MADALERAKARSHIGHRLTSDPHGCLKMPDNNTGPKTVPLGALALRALAELPRQEGSPYVLPAERGNGHFVGIQKPWQRVRGGGRARRCPHS